MSKKEKYDIFAIIFGVIVTIPMLILTFTVAEDKLGPSDVKTLIILPFSLLAYLLLIYDFLVKTVKNFKKKRFFDEITLTLIASLVAFIVGEYVEGLAVVVFFQIGEKFEDYAVNKSRKSIKEVLDIRSDKATLYLENGIEKIVDPYDVNVDDLIIVKSGERIPLDGVVFKGNSFLDTSSLTGESVPRRAKEGDNVLSGVINKGSPLIIKVTKPFYDSTVSKIMDMVENATNTKTKNEKFITKFSKYYTPIVLILALLIAIITPFFGDYASIDSRSNSFFNAASLLVVSCPCALVLSVPMAYFVGIGEASKIKMLIKGSAYLEDLAKLDTVILDKTGTITKGNFVLTDIIPVDESVSKDEILKLARIAEYNSLHPIALSIIGNNKNDIDISEWKNEESIDGEGIKGEYKDKILLAGNSKLLDRFNIPYIKNDEIGTIVYIAYDNKFLGSMVIKDEIKEDSEFALKEFKKLGIKNTFMLTGDNLETASYVAKKCNIENVKANLLPLDKVDEVKKIKGDKNNKMVAFAGDGVNDAPSMAIVDLGISMGGIGSDAAIEASDIVIMDDKLSTLTKGKRIAKRTLNTVYINIVFAILIKLVAVIIATLNIIPSYIMWIAIFADVGVTFLCVCHSLTLMIHKKR